MKNTPYVPGLACSCAARRPRPARPRAPQRLRRLRPQHPGIRNSRSLSRSATKACKTSSTWPQICEITRIPAPCSMASSGREMAPQISTLTSCCDSSATRRPMSRAWSETICRCSSRSPSSSMTTTAKATSNTGDTRSSSVGIATFMQGQCALRVPAIRRRSRKRLTDYNEKGYKWTCAQAGPRGTMAICNAESTHALQFAMFPLIGPSFAWVRLAWRSRLTYGLADGPLTPMPASRFKHGEASGRALRILLACAMGTLPVLHGFFHESRPSDANAATYCTAGSAPDASLTAHDSDTCPICCLLHGGSAPAEVPTRVDAHAPITWTVIAEQCSVVSCFPLPRCRPGHLQPEVIASRISRSCNKTG
jgi:hypothetical protein